MSVEGKWNLTIKSPTGPMSTVLELKEVDGVITGSQTGQGTTTEIVDAKFADGKLSWVNHITKPMKMKCEFNAQVDGGNLSGKMKAGFMGSFTFTGVKA